MRKDSEYIEYGANVRVGFYEVPRMVQDDPLKRKQIMIGMEGATENKNYMKVGTIHPYNHLLL